MNRKTISRAITLAGGQSAVARACDVRQQAVFGWIERGSLPRTEWTGETTHAGKISALAGQLGHEVHASDLCPGASQYMAQAA